MASKEPLSVPSFWKAKYDFQGNEEENQLSFKAGDTFVMMQLHEGGWFTAQRNGETGYVPSNYFEEITTQTPAKVLPVPPQRKPRSNTQLASPTQDRAHLTERSQSATNNQQIPRAQQRTQDDSSRPASNLNSPDLPKLSPLANLAVNSPRQTAEKISMTEPGAARNLAPPPQFTRGAPVARTRGVSPRGANPPNIPRSATSNAILVKPRGLTESSSPQRPNPTATRSDGGVPSTGVASIKIPPPAPKRSMTASNPSALVPVETSSVLENPSNLNSDPIPSEAIGQTEELTASDSNSFEDLHDTSEDLELRDSGVVYVQPPGTSSSTSVDDSAPEMEDSHTDEPIQKPPLPSAVPVMFKPPDPSSYPPIPSRSDKEAHNKIAAALSSQLSQITKQASVASNRIGEPIPSPQSNDQLSPAQTQSLINGLLFFFIFFFIFSKENVKY